MQPLIIEKLGKLTPNKIAEFLATLTPDEAMSLACSWEMWALSHQRLPPGKWRRWIMRCGRGTGKTFGGAKTTNKIARNKEKIGDGEIGIIARTYTDGRVTCVEGPSGILKTADPDFVPTWRPGNGRGLLTWPNGVRGHVLSADEPASIRGLNGAWVWADEADHWHNPAHTWQYEIEPVLRVGWARALITTTPIPGRFLTDLEAKKSTVVTRASIYDNPFLSAEALDSFHEDYDGTTAGLQELYGEILKDNAFLLWMLDTIDKNRRSDTPELSRVVVAIDPAGTANRDSDMTGIVVVGRDRDGHGYVLEDATMKGKPHQWALRAIQLYRHYRADRIVAEVNFGGDMVENTLRGIDRSIPYKAVRASRGKVIRAEPISAMYERGLIHHVGVFSDLENQMCVSGDTLVLTRRGSIPIRQVSVRDEVWTRVGWRKVLRSWCTGISRCLEIVLEGDQRLRCTAKHPVWVEGSGFIPASEIHTGDRCHVLLHENSSNTEGSNTFEATAEVGSTTGLPEQDLAGGLSSTESFMRRRMGPYRTDIISITGTTTASTTPSPIFKLCPPQITSTLMGERAVLSQLRSHGAALKANGNGRQENPMPSHARVVASRFRAPGCEQNTAHLNVVVNTTRERGDIEPVYNLTVEGQPEFFADGVLVHNCGWLPGHPSPDRIDALVWGLTDLLLDEEQVWPITAYL